MPVKNYVFRAYPPTRQAKAVDDAMILAHRYRNKLCELELQRRAKLNEMLQQLAPDYLESCDKVTAKEEEYESLCTEIKKASQAAQRKIPPTDEQKEAVKRIREELKELRKANRELKKQAYQREAIVTEIEKVQAEHNAACKVARAESGIYWGTYLTVEDSAKDFGKGPPPRFARWQGNGTIAVQLQNGLAIEDAINSEDTRLQLILKENREKPKHRLEERNGRLYPVPQKPAKGKYSKFGKVRIRVGSQGRNPVFAEFPIRWTRDLPEGSKIKWAYVSRRQVISPNYKNAYWELRLTVQVPHETRQTDDSLVAVHVGWRKLSGGGLRVAMWRGSDGKFGELIIPPDRVKYRSMPNGLQSIRDKKFEKVKRVLAKWIDRAVKRGTAVPEFLTKARETMRLWKSIQRMHDLLLQWRENRFAGDESIFVFLHGRPEVPKSGWRKWDKHLWLWERHQQTNIVRWRSNEYRVFARKLAREYGMVCLLQADWAEMREKPDILTDDGSTTSTMRANASLAAVSTLERYVKEAFGSDCLVPVDVKNLTTDCHQCGSRESIGTSLRHQCSGCGATWDIDKNASRNQLARAMEARKELPSLKSIMQDRLRENSGDSQATTSKRQQAFRKNKKDKADSAA